MISKFLTPVINVFKFHKKKIGVFLLALLFFSVILFHYNDLGDLVSGKVAEATNGTVSLQFDDLGLSFFPFGVKLSNVAVTTPMIQELKVETLALSPAIWGLLTGSPGVKVRLGGIFDGGIYASIQKETKDKSEFVKVNADWSTIAVANLLKLAAVNLPAKGSIDGELEDVKIDLKFLQPPTGKVILKSKGLEFPTTALAIPRVGTIDTPNLKFSEVALTASLKDRDLMIENGVIGNSKDEIYGNLTGRIGVQINVYPSGVATQFNNYKLNLELRVKEKASTQGYLPLALGFIEKCKVGGDKGTLAYRCVFEGAQFGLVPKISTF